MIRKFLNDNEKYERRRVERENWYGIYVEVIRGKGGERKYNY